jgi:Flp pilus assembly protein TadG
MNLLRQITRFRRADDGVALVEFAVVLPMMILVFAVIIEGSRLMLAYQAAIAGVRDAARYLARVVPSDVCATGGSVSGYATTLRTIVATSTSGTSVLPTSVTVNSVTPTLACVAGTYRVSPAPVATVTASITVAYPFAGVWGLFGASLPTKTTTVTDRARVFGS